MTSIPRTPNLQVAYRLDCSWQLCPVPILMAEEKIAELAEGEVLEVIFTDPGARADLRAWCAASGHTLIAFADARPASSAFVRKGAAPWKK